MRSGMHRFYSTAARSELRNLFQQLSDESEAMMSICAAIHVYLTEGNSVTFMEHTDRALRIFRAELDGNSGSAVGGTMCAGLLVCTLSVSYLCVHSYCLIRFLPIDTNLS